MFDMRNIMRFIASLVLLMYVSLPSTDTFKIKTRMVHGKPAKLGQFGYYAYLDIQTFGFGKSVCGASLINDEWLVSAAHCVERAVKIEIHLGENVLNGMNPEHVIQTAYQEHIHVNPAFDYSTADNDIALIQLPHKIQFSTSIQPVDLPKNCEKPSNVDVVTVGHGYTSNEADISDQLNYVLLKTIPLGDCQETFPMIGERKIFVCAKGAQDVKQSICNGDSGGPLVTVSDKVQIASASFTVQSGCETGAPQAFTYVYPYLSWIKKLTGLNLPSCE